MSTIEPPPDPDIDHLDFDVEMPREVPTVSTLTEIELVDARDKCLRELYERGEALHPTTETGRDLHAWRTAILVELSKRGLR